MRTLRSMLIRLARGTLGPPGATIELPSSPSIVDDAAVEDALRYTVRAEVAGAAPTGDAWNRLQRRLQQEASAGAEIFSFPVPVRPYMPPPRPWWLATELRPRFSPLGIAVLRVLLVAGDVNSRDPVVEPSRTPTAIERGNDNVSLLLPGPARMSRLERIEDGINPTTSAPPVTDPAPAGTAVAVAPLADAAIQAPVSREQLAAMRVGWALRQAPDVQITSTNRSANPANRAEAGSDPSKPLNSDADPNESINQFHRIHAR